MKKFISRFPLLKSIIISCIIGIAGMALIQLINFANNKPEYYEIPETVVQYIMISFVWGIFLAALLIYPVVLLISQIVMLVLEAKNRLRRSGIDFDQIVIWYGLILEFLYLGFVKEITGLNWQEQLTNNERHVPIYTEASFTVMVIFLFGVIGYYYLRLVPLKKIPPLLSLISISAMYLWGIEVIVFTVQVIEDNIMDLILLLYPFCIICIIARTILCKVREWSEISMGKSKIYENAFLNFLDRMLSNSRLWPLYSLIIMIPLLGIVIGILMLFGQAPDSVIKAWTETSDWRLSMKEGSTKYIL